MPKTRTILSIQSDVVAGHVGNGAARFALQRLGFDVWAVPTVLFSNHPGHGKFRGEITPAPHLAALIDGLADRGWLKDCDAVVSGYLGAPDQAAIVAAAVERIKAAKPDAVFLCDPVFGDDAGAYARPGVAEAIARDLIPLADIVTPNRFELSSLTARTVRDAGEAVAAARALGKRETVVTSVPFGGEIGTLAVTPSGAWAAKAPRVDATPNGTGDLLAALYLAARLDGMPAPAALERATSATHSIILASSGARELRLIAAQDQLTAPAVRLAGFPVPP